MGGVGAAHPDPHSPEVRRPQPRLDGLQAVVAGQPAPEASLDPAEGEVDLVVHDDHVLRIHAECSHGGADGLAGVVHVGLRQEHAHARPAGAGAAVGEEAGVLLLRLRQPPALGSQRRHLEPHVVARAGVAIARIAEPHHKPVRLPAAAAAEERHSESSDSSAGASPSSSAASASASSASSPTSSVSSSISSGSSTSVGTTTVAMIVSSGSSRKVTPLGGVISERCIVAAISIPDTSTSMESGMSVGSASMLSWWVT